MEILKKIVNQVEQGKIKKVYVGLFTTVVISRHVGLSSTLRTACGEKGHLPLRNSGNLEGMDIKELAEYVFSNNILEASIGMAAINSGLPLIEDRCEEINAFESILQYGKNKTVAVIGHFPFVHQIEKEVKQLLVFEEYLRPGDIPSARIPNMLPEADVVAISGTTLINHTFFDIIKFCKPTAYKIILGPSTPLTPVLFDYGIDALSGTIVNDVKLLLKSLSQGATFKELKGKKLVTIKKIDYH